MEYRHLFCSHLFNVCIIFIHLTLYLSINVCVGVSVWVRVGVSASGDDGCMHDIRKLFTGFS